MYRDRLSSLTFSLLASCVLALLLPAASAVAASGFVVTGVSPKSFNPARGQATTISYHVPTLSDLRIGVRNSAGAEIRQIVNYVDMPAGNHTRVWDGKDRYGRVVPAGVYAVFVEGTTKDGARIATGSSMVAVGRTAGATRSAFTVTTIRPQQFNPGKGQSAKIAYTVPALSNLRIGIRNSAGTEIRQIVNYVNMPIGSYTRVWDGRDKNGQLVRAGRYTAFVEGNTVDGGDIRTGTGTVSVVGRGGQPGAGSDIPGDTGWEPSGDTGTIQPGSAGQLVEGAGRANYDSFKNGNKAAVTFRAPKSGSITRISVPFRYSSGYGAGTTGSYTVQLQSNGSSNYPSGRVIAQATGLRPSAIMSSDDAPFTAPIKASLTAGQVYHLVFINTDASPSRNYASLNTVMTRVTPWNPAQANDARMLNGSGNSWSPWASNSDPWNSGGNNANGSHVALVLKWADGSVTGDPYWSAAMGDPAHIAGSRYAGELIVWKHPTTSVSRVGVSVKGSGTLYYHLEKVGGGELASGTFADTASSRVPTWKFARLSRPVTLQQGQTYRLWFAAPGGSYTQNPVYGPNGPGDWITASYGGFDSCVITGSGGSWTKKPTQDLAFSLQ